ncbi:SatD family protein [Halorubellus litoreus]|uniref:SatD family protein n=1 Tax=Halorubellus litoreus TaxID=755308 RepID=A0ABD5V8P3_9EURY
MTVRRCVVLGDVVDSRNLDDREDVRETLEAAVAAATDAAGDAIVAPFAVLKGVDEVGGVLDEPGAVVPALRALVEHLHPIELRVGLAWGAVDVAPDADAVAAMDGPAFHRADECLQAAAADDRYVRVSLADVPDVFAAVLGDQLDLLSLWTSTWTPRQRSFVTAYRDADTMTAVADAFDVSVQMVSKTLDRTRAATVYAVEDTLEAAFAAVGGDDTW